MPYNHMYYRHRVAPRVGAWIETHSFRNRRRRNQSLPVWERGLKLHRRQQTLQPRRRSPCGSVD